MAELKRVVARFVSRTQVPKRHGWKHLSNDQIWRMFVVQVAAVGRAAPGAHIAESPDALRALGLRRLSLLSPPRRRAAINKVLRDFRVRYASQNAEACRKSAALTRNYDILAAFPGGPKGYVRSLIKLKRDDARVTRLAAEMQYIKLKGARDLLVELGVVKDVVALDTRVLNILRRFGAVVPKNVQTDPDSYRALQNELVARVCKPLRITGAALDRVLFQNYKEILKLPSADR